MLLDVPQNVMTDIMARHAYHFPNKPALIFPEQRLSWREMNQGINRVANRLLASGLKKGDRVCCLMGTSVDCLLLMFGTMKAGGVIVPISTMLPPDQVCGLVNDSGARYVFTDTETLPLANKIVDQLSFVQADKLFSEEAGGCWHSYHAWLDDAPSHEPGVKLTLNDDAAISYTSGTTGLPKGIVYSHHARLHLGLTYAWHMKIDGASLGIATTPLYSNGTSIIVFPVLFAGGTLAFMKKFDAAEFFSIVEKEKATHTFMVPTQFVKLLEEASMPTRDLSSMRMYISGGSSMRPELKLRFMDAVGPKLSELYGMSEGGIVMIRPDEILERPSACGIPLPGFEARIVGADDKEVPRGEAGEIVFHGGWSMRGYHNQPQKTLEALWRDEHGRQFVRSGDIGRMDDDGYVYIVDRKKDMIISGGFNVFPSDIEAVLLDHPAVAEAAVIGVSDALWGETPLGLVILRSGSSPDSDALKAWANEKLAKTQRLCAVVFLDQFPRNALGKVQKPELRARFKDFRELGSDPVRGLTPSQVN